MVKPEITRRMFSARRNRSTSANVHEKHRPTKQFLWQKKFPLLCPPILQRLPVCGGENKFHFFACLTQFFCSMAVTMSPLNTHWIPFYGWDMTVFGLISFKQLHMECSLCDDASSPLLNQHICLTLKTVYNKRWNQNNLFSTRGKFSLPVWKALFTSMLHAV